MLKIKLKIIFGFAQVLVVYGSVFSADLPDDFVDLTRALSLLLLDVRLFGDYFSFSCWHATTHYSKLVLFEAFRRMIFSRQSFI